MKDKRNYHSIQLELVTATKKRSLHQMHLRRTACALYHNAQHLLIQLTAVERGYLDYLCEHMDDKNRIIVDRDQKEAYSSFMLAVTKGGVKVGIRTIDTAVKKLKELGLLFEVGTSRGYFYVNPKHFWAGPEKARVVLIKQLIEERFHRGLTVGILSDQPLDSHNDPT